MDSSADIRQKAIKYIKENKKDLCEKFANLREYPPVLNPNAYFMAGSPGAGKTEYSKSFIELLMKKNPDRRIVRIDADEIRDWIPFYDRKNALDIQGAAALGVEKLLDCVLIQGQDFLLDGTFADYDKVHLNITRSIHKNRKISIQYLYQDPIIAWEFTKKRERLEGRRVPKEMFLKAFFDAKDNVNKIKKEFGRKVELDLVIKNYEQGIEKPYFNIDNVDGYLKIEYTAESLGKLLV